MLRKKINVMCSLPAVVVLYEHQQPEGTTQFQCHF
jgi:hypothetical protein